MLRFFALSSAFLALIPVHAQQWMGLEDDLNTTIPTSIGIQSSIDDANNTSYALNLFTPLNDNILLQANLIESYLKDETITFSRSLYFAQLNFIATDTQEFALAYQYEGKKQTLETEHNQLLFRYTPYPWTIDVEFTQGSLDIFTRTDLPFANPLPSKLESDYEANSIELSWWFDGFTIAFKRKEYDYQRNISLLSSNQRLQLLVKPNALLNSGILLSKESKLSLIIPLEANQLFLSLETLTSAIDNNSNDIFSIDYSYRFNKNLRWLSAFSQTLGQTETWTLALGLEWSF